jgi:outer membrane receptor for ferrienterochelin and colicin
MRTAFNGFGRVERVEVADEPMATLYGREDEAAWGTAVQR